MMFRTCAAYTAPLVRANGPLALLCGLLMLALLVLVVVVIVRLARRGGAPRPFPPYGPGPHPGFGPNPGSAPNPAAGALAILNERLAKGEIGTEEYNRLKAEILK